jgi:hypothetical protein
MVTPLVVTAGSAEVSRDRPTLREWLETAPLALCARSRDESASSLNEDSVNVRRSVGS